MYEAPRNNLIEKPPLKKDRKGALGLTRNTQKFVFPESLSSG
jgi:hypothetical protein